MTEKIPEYDRISMKLQPQNDYQTLMLTKFINESNSKIKGCLKFIKEYSVNQGVEINCIRVKELLSFISDVKNFPANPTNIQGKNIPLYLSQLITQVNKTAEI